MTSPAHIAIIMDGNGRWAQARGLPRTAGHRAGVEALRQAVRNVGEAGASFMTVYAFSSENWARPASEISDLMSLLRLFIRRDLAQLHRNNVRVRMIGGRDTLAADILKLIVDAEELTHGNTGLTLVIAFNYGARDEIVRAARHLAQMASLGRLDPASITPEMLAGALDTADIPDPDLIVRTSGEQRLSNFLMWQAAYSELVFLPCLWPDFDKAQLDRALAIYAARDRRFGAVAAVADAQGAVN